MFSSRCSKCESKVKNDSNFCPSCGLDLRSEYEQDDYGVLGRDDNTFEEQMSFSDNFMEKMFNSALKVLEKQMKNLGSEMNNPQQNRNPRKNNPGLNVQFFVNGERVLNDNATQTHQPVKITNTISKEKLKRFAELPKQEPKSRIKRLSDKVIYELVVPGVDSIEDVLINQLESSIEIKALGKDVVYSKNLNINLPILRYHLAEDNLIIEMQAK
jgi:HSP20 family molecular chaperone IbpA